MSEITLGKSSKNIDFSKLKSGITKEDLGIEDGTILANIFDSINTNNEGESKNKLDRDELTKFIDIIRNLYNPKDNDDTNLSESEAKNYVYGKDEEGKELKLGRKHKEELLTFLSKLSELTKGVTNVETETTTHTETITYEDGHTEQVKPDGSKVIISKDGKSVTEKDANGNTTKQTVKTDKNEIVTEFEPGSTNPKKRTILKKDTRAVILYAQGKEIKSTVAILSTGEIQEYEYIDDYPTLRKITNTKTGEVAIYNNDGTVANKKVTTKRGDETIVSETVYNGENSTKNVSINGKASYQKKIIDGNEYEVRYDENGNTTGVIVQRGESVKAIADKFGVTPEALVKANAHLLKGGKRSFRAGDEIVIPRQMQADEYAKAQEGRKSADEVKAEYNAEMQRRAAARARSSQSAAQAGVYDWKGQKDVDWVYIKKRYPKGTSAEAIARELYSMEGNTNPPKNAVMERANAIQKAFAKYFDNNGKVKKEADLFYRISKKANSDEVVTKRTHNKYDVNHIKNNARALAAKIHNQIEGASLNENTINLLRGITPENVAFVVSEYQNMYGVSLAKDIDDEWGLDLNTVKEHVCKKLVDQAKKLGINGVYHGDYRKINDLASLQNWINNAASKVRNAMSKATTTYYATDAEEAQRSQSAENAKTAKTSAEQIVNDLIKNTSGWNDVDKIKAIIARIDNPEELKEVNRLLTVKGYPPTDKYSPIENFIYQEANNSLVHTYNSSDYLEQTVQNWIDNGTLKGQEANQAQARMAARVLYDAGDGFGTDEEKIKKAVRMIRCPKPTGNREADNKQAREVYRLVNAMIKKHNTFYGLGSPCTDLLDYCKGEMWDSEVKYLKGILAETNAIEGKEKAQAISDLTQEAVEGAGTDIEYLEQAIKGIDSPADRKAVEAKLKEYCIKKGIKPQIAGQSYLQAILYDECDKFMGIGRDHKEIRNFNEMLIEQGAYTETEIVNLRAEQAALQILEGDFDNIKDAVEQLKDPKVLAKVEQLLTTKGYKSLDEFLNKNLNQTKSDLVNAGLASNNLLANEKAAVVAYRLIKNSDFNNRAQGIRAIRNEAVAKLVDEKLKQEGSSLAKVMEQFNKEKAEYKAKADFWDGLGKSVPMAGLFAEDISDAYRINTDGSDNMFVEMAQSQNLTPQQKDAYARTVKLMEQKLAQMEKDYKAALESQGAVSWAVNRFCEYYGIGTTREEIEARLEHDKETVRLLKLAAEGKLGKMVNGKTVAVTFEEVFKERNIGTNFNTGKVEKVEKQAQILIAMNYAKTNIAICWEELENGLNSFDLKRLSVAIIDTLEKLSNMTGKKLSLAGYGYSVKNSIIVDSSGRPISVDKLRELANQLKQGLSDVAKDLLGEEIPLNTSSSKINDILENSYNKKKESFKQEFKDAFGQDCPDEMIEKYISTIETGKMVANIGAIIGGTILAPFTFGGSLATFLGVGIRTAQVIATGMGAGVTSLGMNALEHSTDANGWTNAEWTSDAEQAMWDGLLAALGMKVGMIADAKAIGTYKTAAQNMLKKLIPNITEKTLDRASVCIARVRAMGYEVSSDTIQSLAQTYCQHGEFDEESFVRDLLISVAGNSVGHTVSGVGEVRGSKSNVGADAPREYPTADAARRGRRDDIADGETARNADQSHLNARERAMVEEGLEETPTRKEVDAYQKEHEYKEPTTEERAVIDRNNAETAEADTDARRIENNIDEKSADAIKRARENVNEPDINQNGIYKDNEGNEYTLTNGKITEIRTPDGKVIEDEVKIAKFTSKRNINSSELEAVKTDVPDVEVPEPDEIKPQEHDTNAHRFSDDEIIKFSNIIADNAIELDEKLTSLGFERGLIGNDGFDGGGIFYSYINKKTGVQYIFSVENNKILPKRMTLTDIDTNTKYHTIELKRDANGNIIETVEKNAENSRVTDSANSKNTDNTHFSQGQQQAQGEIDVDIESSLNNPAKASSLHKKLGDRLFTIYQGVERGLETLKDISGYNKLKNIITNQFKNSPIEMGELLTRLNRKARNIGLHIVETSADRALRMGKSLAKYYDKIESAISSMTDLKRFNKLLDKITTKFANYKDDMKVLIDKLYVKANAIDLSVKESIHDIYARAGIKAEGANPLDKYTHSKKGVDMSKSHDDWFNSRKDLFGDNHDYPGAVWSGYTPKDRHHGAWKMHLFSVSEADWRKMCDVIIPYLKEHDIDWKTFNAASGADCLNGSKQQGKAFTIYPKNNEDMAQIAKDLDYIIKKNKLETNGSHITGDNQMGSTGRLFYRYEFNSGAHKDEILDLSPGSSDWNKYYQTDRHGRQVGGYYDANRGEGRYLADDMTLEDDIWRNFDPADPNSQPASSSSAQGNRTNTAKLRKGQYVEIQGSAKLNLANTFEIDLDTPQIKAKINNLPEGGRLTIGREGDIRINDPSNTVSRIHVIIEKRNGKIYIIDNSTNGTSISRTTTSQTNSSSHNNAQKFDTTGNSDKFYDFTTQNLVETDIYTKDGSVHPEDIGIGQWRNPYVTKTPGIHVEDIRGSALFKANVAYNPKTNASIIKINGIKEDGYSRYSDMLIRINGKISEADAKALIEYLKERIPNIQTMDADINEVRKHTSDFLNNKIRTKSSGNAHRAEQARAEADPIRERAYSRFDKNATPIKMPENAILDSNSQYLLNLNDMPALRLIDGTIVDLRRADILDKIKNLQEGEYITLGRNGDIRISNSPNISRHHIIITKQNGQIQLKDVSSYANTKAMSQAGRNVRADAIRKFNKNQSPVEMPNNSILNSQDNYVLDFNDLPKLRLVDGTVIDLSSPKYYNAIKHLREGGFITIGRTGFADIGISNSNTISRHHLLLTIQNGELILKDVSSNGGTYRVDTNSKSSSRAESNSSEDANESNHSHSSKGADNKQSYEMSDEKIKEYKDILGLDANAPLTKENIKKAYRKKSIQWHPDRNPENREKATDMMQKINEAKEALDKIAENLET